MRHILPIGHHVSSSEREPQLGSRLSLQQLAPMPSCSSPPARYLKSTCGKPEALNGAEAATDLLSVIGSSPEALPTAIRRALAVTAR